MIKILYTLDNDWTAQNIAMSDIKDIPDHIAEQLINQLAEKNSYKKIFNSHKFFTLDQIKEMNGWELTKNDKFIIESSPGHFSVFNPDNLSQSLHRYVNSTYSVDNLTVYAEVKLPDHIREIIEKKNQEIEKKKAEQEIKKMERKVKHAEEVLKKAGKLP